MKRQMSKASARFIGCVLAAMVIFAVGALAGRKPAPAVITLTPDGEKLRAKYNDLLKALHTEIASALPKVDEQKKNALEQSEKSRQGCSGIG